jgi:hypothetical protein
MTSRLAVCIEGPTHAGQAFARAESLAARISAHVSATLYAAPLEGEVLALGAHQHAPHALTAAAFERAEVLRRATGGVTVRAGSGIAYVALCLRDASALVACPAGKLLNRYVRGLLVGLRALHVPAYYFGRDFISANADPCAYVGWAEGQDGSVQLEAFIALEQSFALPLELCAYPEPSEPRFRGKPLTTLAAVLGKSMPAQAVLEAILEGYARMAGAELSVEALDDAAQQAAAPRAKSRVVELASSDALVWSQPYEEAIGFVSAAVALDARGTLREIEIGGDLMQSDRALAALRAALIGRVPDTEAVGAALDRAYASRGATEGVRSLRSLQTALLDAIESAKARSRSKDPT